MPAPRTIAWGILGTGNIARKIAEGIRESASGHLAAVGSRSIETARAFAHDLRVPRAFGAYDDVLASDEVEAVCIALPNHLHAEWTIRCAAAGKHVLCEKPLAVNRAEAERVVDAVRKAGVFLMEGFMYRCHPQTARIAELLRAGAIGEVRLIQASFCFAMDPARGAIRLSNATAGGSIMDVGCYPMSMARLAVGAAGGNVFLNPSEVRGVAHLDGRSRVDLQAVAAVKFPGGCVASLSCGYQAQVDNTLRIWGAHGHITVPVPWKPPQKNARILVLGRGETSPTEILVDAPASLYATEIDTVGAAIARGDREVRPPGTTWADSLGNMAGLDAWRADAGLSFSCERR
jgi:predicted dehydrogenase